MTLITSTTRIAGHDDEEGQRAPPERCPRLAPELALQTAELPGHERRGHQGQDQEERRLDEPAEEAEAEHGAEDHAASGPAQERRPSSPPVKVLVWPVTWAPGACVSLPPKRSSEASDGDRFLPTTAFGPSLTSPPKAATVAPTRAVDRHVAAERDHRVGHAPVDRDVAAEGADRRHRGALGHDARPRRTAPRSRAAARSRRASRATAWASWSRSPWRSWSPTAWATWSPRAPARRSPGPAPRGWRRGRPAQVMAGALSALCRLSWGHLREPSSSSARRLVV